MISVPASASPIATDIAGVTRTSVYRLKHNPAVQGLFSWCENKMESRQEWTKIVRSVLEIIRSVNSVLGSGLENSRASRGKPPKKTLSALESSLLHSPLLLAALEVRKSQALAYNHHNQLI